MDAVVTDVLQKLVIAQARSNHAFAMAGGTVAPLPAGQEPKPLVRCWMDEFERAECEVERLCRVLGRQLHGC